jgi:muramoyltetrapeptide carboxypeptidase LdcA involved in peptidoglycan recycling
MFADPDVRAIVTAIGGDHSCHLLPLLDFDLIRTHPKIFVGYSDTTVLSVAIRSATGLVTFQDPALLTDFAEHPAMFDYTREAFLRVLSATQPPAPVAPATEWTDELLDWGKKRDLDMDFGHTAPQLTLPVGIAGSIEVGRRRFELLEAAVE